MICYSFVKPYDIFMPRGNSHFGVTSGDFGQIRMLPSPSLFAGAFRSALSAYTPQALTAIEKGEKPQDAGLAKALGSLSEPGDFRITMTALAVRAAGKINVFFQLPADLVVFGDDGNLEVASIKPVSPPENIGFNLPLPLLPILKAPRKKQVGGFWLNEAGYAAYISGEECTPAHLVADSKLWKKEIRVGVTLDGTTRSAAEGRLYSAEAVSFADNVGFITGILGVQAVLPDSGELRLGGDARAAHFEKVNLQMPVYQAENLNKEKSFKLVTSSPCIFEKGWLPDFVERDTKGFHFRQKDFSARLVCAAINGHDVVSGWNMVKGQPKEAVRVVPAGSVYWFDSFEGNPSALATFIENGLFGENTDRQRVAEGFNRAFLASYISK